VREIKFRAWDNQSRVMMLDYQNKEGRLVDPFRVDRFRPAPLLKRIARISLVAGLVFLIYAIGGAEF